MIVRNVIRRRRWRWKEKSRYCLKDAGWVIGMVAGDESEGSKNEVMNYQRETMAR